MLSSEIPQLTSIKPAVSQVNGCSCELLVTGKRAQNSKAAVSISLFLMLSSEIPQLTSIKPAVSQVNGCSCELLVTGKRAQAAGNCRWPSRRHRPKPPAQRAVSTYSPNAFAPSPSRCAEELWLVLICFQRDSQLGLRSSSSSSSFSRRSSAATSTRVST